MSRNSTTIKLKRAYEEPQRSDGQRVLVDRIWPRGVSKDTAQIDLWLKDIAPSKELRQWFGHKPERWAEFKKRYFSELNNNQEALKELKELLGKPPVTFVFSARDEKHNNAVALKEYLQAH